MYLTTEVIAATLRQVAALAPGSTFAMSFMLPIEMADPEVRPGIERAFRRRSPRSVRSPPRADRRRPSRRPSPPQPRAELI
jgi:hypothetical protein